jgi:hypothetical protein
MVNPIAWVAAMKYSCLKNRGGGFIMRKIVVLAVVVFLVLGLAGLAVAGTIKVKAKPFIFDPDDLGNAAAAWVTHQGLPDAGKSAHALMLEMSAVGGPQLYAGVAIQGVKGLAITELGFDMKSDGVFTTGPRFEVYTDASADGVPFPLIAATSTTPDTPVAGWTRLRFVPVPESLPGVVQSVRIVFDEEGSVLLDNIDFNGALMGKPGNAKLAAPPKGKK